MTLLSVMRITAEFQVHRRFLALQWLIRDAVGLRRHVVRQQHAFTATLLASAAIYCNNCQQHTDEQRFAVHCPRLFYPSLTTATDKFMDSFKQIATSTAKRIQSQCLHYPKAPRRPLRM